MDFLTLFLCGKCTHQKIRLGRLCAGAGLGALGSVILLFLPQNRTAVLLAGILLSGLMTVTVFGTMGTWYAFLRQCILVWGCGALAGGVLSVVLSLGTPVYTNLPENPSYPSAFLLTALFCVLIGRIFTHRSRRTTAELTITRGSRSVVVQALVDSGNLLCDPLSGRSVILASAQAIQKLYPPVDPTCPEGVPGSIRLIPAETAGGKRILCGVLPDGCTVDGIPRDVVLVVEDTPSGQYGGCGALCPADLIGSF